MELYRKGEWSSTPSEMSDQDVMTLAGRPGLLSRNERAKNYLHSDTTMSNTPDPNTPEASIPSIAHPLLMEYLMRVQNAQLAEGKLQPSIASPDPSISGFISDQDIFPPFIPDAQGSMGRDWTEGLFFGDTNLSGGIQFGGPSSMTAPGGAATAYPGPSYPLFGTTDTSSSTGHSGSTQTNSSILPYLDARGLTSPMAQRPPQDDFWRMFLNDLDMMPSGGGDGA